MTKDEMKNRISLALKDPILQQGFEIICKENATLKVDYGCLEDAHNVLNELYEKLEKENTELKEKCSILDKSLITSTKNNIERQKIIDRLKEENTQLRNNGFTVSAMTEQQLKVALKKGEQLEKENTELKSELTKAKEILEELAKMEYVINPPVDKVRSLMVKAEQFLNSENIILKDAQAGNSPFDADEVFNKEMKAYPEEK